ncbi:MAG: excinuclease ABC subunit UvrC [Pseudomonadota bacterium]|nr:excinuclease ABC subunit UvrC [Pseudomonadota bacterium]
MVTRISVESPYLIPKGKEEIRDFIRGVPKNPGVYKFLDKSKKHLYIGKAKYLNKRLASYFRVASRSKKIDKLFDSAKFIELSLTNTELESLLYEQFLIKKYKPKFNVQFKDDKGYPWIKIETNKVYPSAKSFLGKKDNNGKFFGPFPNPYAVRNALKLIQKTFKLRNCSDSYFKNRSRPCLQYEIGRCSAPCVGLITQEEYQIEVEGANLLLTGQSEELIKEFYDLMDKFSSEKRFEKAAIFRDRISALREIQRSQSVAGFKENRDAIYLSSFQNKYKIGVSSVNHGWVTGHKNFILEEVFDEEEILESFITYNYLSTEYCPPVLVIGKKLKNKTLIEKALSSFHSKKISLLTQPSQKDRGLLDICKANTEFISKRNKLDLDIDLKIDALKSELKIDADIKNIESYDISHHSGDYAVAGCVVYSNEGKEKNMYRSYNISKENSGNDIGSMLELIERRFSQQKQTKTPDLILIDGGSTHLHLVKRKMKELGLEKINIISISKGVRRKSSFDSIHLEEGESLIVKKGSVFHHFIQEIRDETHRYAISLQKRKRAKVSLDSSIDNISGVGATRKKLLLRYFGSLEQIKRASIDDLSEVSGIGRFMAKSIYKQLHK